ncbi:hypothetical protein Tco_0790112 [Tanacetum coccineum]
MPDDCKGSDTSPAYALWIRRHLVPHFVSEHIETLEEIHMEDKELALEFLGMIGGVPALGVDTTPLPPSHLYFITTADSLSSLPAMTTKNAQCLIPELNQR